MSKYALSIVVYGLGEDPNARSHWALAVHPSNANVGTLLHVNVIDSTRLIYSFDERTDVFIRSKSSEGSFALADLDIAQVRKAKEVIRTEEAPRDGKERCQDWVLRTLISLEAEEIVPPGTSAMVECLVGQPAASVASAVGRMWTPSVE